MNNLVLEINGKSYIGFTNISVINDIETASGYFNFSATNERHITFPIKKGSACKVLIKNIPIITGYVNGVNPGYSAYSHSIAITGRDKTQDLIDSTISGNIDLKGKIKLEDIINAVLTNIELDIDIVNEAGEIKEFDETELSAADKGNNAFAFVEYFCRQRQVLLSSNGEGNIRLLRGDQAKDIGINGIFNEFTGKNTNILEANLVNNDSNRFYKYLVRSQGNSIAGLDVYKIYYYHCLLN